MKTNLVLFPKNKNNLYLIKIQFYDSKKRIRKTYNSGVYLEKKYWNPRSNSIREHSNKSFYDTIIENKIKEIEKSFKKGNEGVLEGEYDMMIF